MTNQCLKGDKDFLLRQLVKLGDMMGDGLHYEADGKWISREYNRICRILYPEMFPKKDFTQRNNAVAQWCVEHRCHQCDGELKQTKSGSLRVVCKSCNAKFQLSKKK